MGALFEGHEVPPPDKIVENLAGDLILAWLLPDGTMLELSIDPDGDTRWIADRTGQGSD